MGTLTSPLPSSVSWPAGGQTLPSITPCFHTLQSCLRLGAMGAVYQGLQASGSSRQKPSFLLYSTFLRCFLEAKETCDSSYIPVKPNRKKGNCRWSSDICASSLDTMHIQENHQQVSVSSFDARNALPERDIQASDTMS